MAAFTSTQSGNASSSSTWGGSGPPTDGDTITVATGHTVTQDVNRTYGSNASGVGHAFTINATNSGTYGKLVVPTGVTLTLRGTDLTTNTLGLVNQYGWFDVQSGATVVGDTAGDYSSIILNKGRLTASGATFSSPAGNIDWSSAVASEAVSSGSLNYDYALNIKTLGLAHQWVSNAGGTAIGTSADSSLSFSGKTPSTILATEVASLAAVDATGEYYVDYDRGLVYFYTTAGTNTATAAYKRLALTKTWGIDSSQSTSYNLCTYDGNTFQYMGPVTFGSTKAAVYVANKKTAAANSSATDRLFSFTNNTVRWCWHFMAIKTCDGTSGDPLLVTGNTFNSCRGEVSGGWAINTQTAVNTYLKLASNALNQRGVFYRVAASVSGTAQDTHTGLKIQDNTGSVGGLFVGPTLAAVYPNGIISGNTTTGMSGVDDIRWVVGFGGTSGNEALIYGNSVGNANRIGNYTSHSRIYNNFFHRTYHHILIAPTEDDLAITNIRIYANVLAQIGGSPASYNTGPLCETGYNHRHWIDDIVIVNNTTVHHPNGPLGLSDVVDSSGQCTLNTNVVAANNLAYNASAGGTAGGIAGVTRQSDSTVRVVRLHVKSLDYGLYYNVTNQYSGCTSTKGYTFVQGGVNYNGIASPTRNLAGLALQFPSYTTTQSGCSVVYTVTSAGSNETIAWNDGGGAGTAVQLVFGNATLTSAGAHATQSASSYRSGATLTDSAATWSTTKNSASCPIGHWLKMTSGAASGQVRAITNCTGTTLTVVPAFATLPSSGDSYTIYKSEIRCNNSGASQSVGIGIDGQVFPFGTAGTDSSISLAFHDATGDPGLVSSSGTTAASFKLASNASPAYHTGIAITSVTPATDYFAITYSATPSMGFAELVSGGYRGLVDGRTQSPLFGGLAR